MLYIYALEQKRELQFFYAFVPVSYGKEYFKCLQRQAFFVVLSAWKKGRKKRNGP